MRPNPTSNPAFAVAAPHLEPLPVEVLYALIGEHTPENEPIILDHINDVDTETGEYFFSDELLYDHISLMLKQVKAALQDQSDFSKKQFENVHWAMMFMSKLLKRAPTRIVIPEDESARTKNDFEVVAQIQRLEYYVTLFDELLNFVGAADTYAPKEGELGFDPQKTEQCVRLHSSIDHDIQATMKRSDIGSLMLMLPTTHSHADLDYEQIEVANNHLETSLKTAQHLLMANATFISEKPVFKEFKPREIIDTVVQYFSERTSFDVHTTEEGETIEAFIRRAFIVSVDENLKIFGDPNLFFYIMFTAVKNALDVARVNPRNYRDIEVALRIDAKKVGDCMLFEVVDTGKGFSKQKLIEKIVEKVAHVVATKERGLTDFEKAVLDNPLILEDFDEHALVSFFNEEGITCRDKGTGLGLSLAQKAAKLTQSTVRLANWRGENAEEDSNQFGALTSCLLPLGGIAVPSRAATLVNGLIRLISDGDTVLGRVISAEVHRETTLPHSVAQFRTS